MLDHYKTLGLARTATADDVKRAFRDLAKRYHPDRNAGRPDWANAQMKEVLEANRVLSCVRRRDIYDRQCDVLAGRARAAAPWSPPPGGNGPESRAKQILCDLLTGNAQAAVEAYEALIGGNGGVDLRDLMESRDWVDCKFLLAEQYQKAAEFERALALYDELFESDEARDRYTGFADEVRDRILKLCCRHLAPSAPPAEAARYYLRALAFELTRSRRAHLHKKLAECHLEVGDDASARRQLEIAFELKPDLKGATKICQRLGFSKD